MASKVPRGPEDLVKASLILTLAGFGALTVAVVMHYRLDYVGATPTGRMLCLVPAIAAVSLLVAAMALLWRAYVTARGPDDPSPLQ